MANWFTEGIAHPISLLKGEKPAQPATAPHAEPPGAAAAAEPVEMMPKTPGELTHWLKELRKAGVSDDVIRQGLHEYELLPQADGTGALKPAAPEQAPELVESVATTPAPVVDVVTAVEHVVHAIEPHKEDMATAPIIPAVPATPSAPAPLSFLKKLEQEGFSLLTKFLPKLTQAVEKAAEIAAALEPEIDLLFPVEGPLYNMVVSAILTAQLASKGVPNAGATKFSLVYNQVAPELHDQAKAAGLTIEEATTAVKNYIQNLFNIYDGPVKLKTAPAAQ